MSDNKQNNQIKKSTYVAAVGRRRESNAQVRLYPITGKKTVTLYGQNLKAGDFLVNKKKVSDYFPGDVNKVLYRQPFTETKSLNDYAVSAVVSGGGKKGQLGATIHGLARALDKSNPEFHSSLKEAGLLTRDPRVKERRKAGLAQKARAKKSSPKR